MIGEYDFIVVGSGAGGGPLASRLAEDDDLGLRVALLEAGTDPVQEVGSEAFYKYSVPIFHTHASEDSHLSWEFFVRHYKDDKRHRESFDPKKGDGVFYPRTAALGGCTTHHAMITLYPHNGDWKNIQDITGDASWSPERMRELFVDKIEDCQYLRPPKPPREGDKPVKPGVERRGFKGWLPLSMPDPTLALGTDLKNLDAKKKDPLLKIILSAFLAAHKTDRTSAAKTRTPGVAAVKQILAVLQGVLKDLPDAVKVVFEELGQRAWEQLDGLEKLGVDVQLKDLIEYILDNPILFRLFRQLYPRLDPNRWFPEDKDRVGDFNTPVSILHGVRTCVRERVLDVRTRYPDRLKLITGALVTKVIFDRDRAVGVEYIAKEGAYDATRGGSRGEGDGKKRKIYVKEGGEVILAGGAFNTPQLLMLSGIGPAEQLMKHEIPLVRGLPGVGQNLHDRYEMTLVTEFKSDFPVLEGLSFIPPKDKQSSLKDEGMKEWMNHRGIYASNGVVMTIIRRSEKAEGMVPDLVIFGLPGDFRGYEQGYADKTLTATTRNRFTWVILKGRTRNRAGTVELAGGEATQRPAINFKYFDEGTAAAKAGEEQPWEKDLDALAKGIEFVKDIMRATRLDVKFLFPEEKVLNDRKELREFLKKQSWGHHACGTCKIGKEGDKFAVLDSNFRVRGVRNLRVVDASVFPAIPGFFIVSAIYTISEKAAKVILEELHNRRGRRS